MSATNVTSTIPAPPINGGSKPGIPVETPNIFDNVWTMYYIFQRKHNAEPFHFNGDAKQARDKAMQFCQAMNYRLLYVLPFLKDLDKELARKAGAVIPKDATAVV